MRDFYITTCIQDDGDDIHSWTPQDGIFNSRDEAAAWLNSYMEVVKDEEESYADAEYIYHQHDDVWLVIFNDTQYEKWFIHKVSLREGE